jgi:hypothetical protein
MADRPPPRLVGHFGDSLDCGCVWRSAIAVRLRRRRQEKAMIGKRAMSGATLFFLFSGLAMSDASSADASKRFGVRGVGTTTCSKYLEERNLDAAGSEQYAHWFTGFLTAYNWLQQDTYDISANYKSNGLLRYLDLYCGRSPKNRIIDAATSFINAVYSKRQKTGS